LNQVLGSVPSIVYQYSRLVAFYILIWNESDFIVHSPNINKKIQKITMQKRRRVNQNVSRTFWELPVAFALWGFWFNPSDWKQAFPGVVFWRSFVIRNLQDWVFTQHSPGEKVSDHISSQQCTTKPDRRLVSLRGQLLIWV